MFEIVKKAIDELNPYNLLPDAPSDEFDFESRSIAGRITVNSTVEEIAQVICDVLIKAFSENYAVEEFMVAAEKIHKTIKDR